MSVAPRKFILEKEVNLMTTATAINRRVAAPTAHRGRPRGLDRLVMRLSIAMLKWARRRADRSAMSYENLPFEERARIHNETMARERRENLSSIQAMRIL
jgi:hypothetical protein